MKTRTAKFTVEIGVPDDVLVADIHGYIEEALGTHCRSLRPPGGYGSEDEGDPLFDIGENVTVKRFRNKTGRKARFADSRSREALERILGPK